MANRRLEMLQYYVDVGLNDIPGSISSKTLSKWLASNE